MKELEIKLQNKDEEIKDLHALNDSLKSKIAELENLNLNNNLKANSLNNEDNNNQRNNTEQHTEADLQ